MPTIEMPRKRKIWALIFIGLILLICPAFIGVGVIALSRVLPPDFPPDLWFVILSMFFFPFPIFAFAAYIIFSHAYSRLQFDSSGINLANPFKARAVDWQTVIKAYPLKRNLCIQTSKSFFSTWSIYLGGGGQPLLGEFKSFLPDGVWLEEKEGQKYHTKKLFPINIVIVLVALGIMVSAKGPLESYMDQRIQEYIEQRKASRSVEGKVEDSNTGPQIKIGKDHP